MKEIRAVIRDGALAENRTAGNSSYTPESARKILDITLVLRSHFQLSPKADFIFCPVSVNKISTAWILIFNVVDLLPPIQLLIFHQDLNPIYQQFNVTKSFQKGRTTPGNVRHSFNAQIKSTHKTLLPFSSSCRQFKLYLSPFNICRKYVCKLNLRQYSLTTLRGWLLTLILNCFIIDSYHFLSSKTFILAKTQSTFRKPNPA